MKKVIFILSIFTIIYSCTKTETSTPTPPVVIKLSGCDSIKQGLLKTTSDTIRLVSCVSITGCDSVRLGLLKSAIDLLRLADCNAVTIGTQKWMKANLDVVTYRNGDIIPQVIDAATWMFSTKGAWCYYNYDPKNGAIYGKLYNWYAVNDSRGLAPKGWHIPTDAEWTTLSTALGGVNLAGGKMKNTGTTLWFGSNTGATNESGFAALPGGSISTIGLFSNVGMVTYWWSATEDNYNSRAAFSRYLSYYDGILNRFSNLKEQGFSVRCLRD